MRTKKQKHKKHRKTSKRLFSKKLHTRKYIGGIKRPVMQHHLPNNVAFDIAHNAVSMNDAISAGNLAQVEELLDLNPNSANLIFQHEGRPSTPLMLAVNLNHHNICVLLIERGANVNFPYSDNSTTLMYAASIGDVEACKILLDYGAEINVKNRDGITALIMAVENDQYDVCNLLLNRGADINIADNGGETALSIAKWYKHYNIVELLLEYGATE